MTSLILTTLRQLRTDRELTLRKVEAETGVFAPHLSEMERGRRMPTAEQLAKLSEFYGVDVGGWTLMLVNSKETP